MKNIKIKLFYYFIITFIILLFIFIFIFRAYSRDIKICVCTLGKNENRYIREFIEHYKNYGVDKIFLYDNNDINGESFQDVIYDYIKDNYIKIINYRGRKRIQHLSLRDCYRKNIMFFDWFILIDLDEYIFLKNYKNIKDYLNRNNFKYCQVINLNQVFYTDNDLLHYDNRTLKERFPIKDPRVRGKTTGGTAPIKSLVRGKIPKLYIIFYKAIHHTKISFNLLALLFLEIDPLKQYIHQNKSVSIISIVILNKNDTIVNLRQPFLVQIDVNLGIQSIHFGNKRYNMCDGFGNKRYFTGYRTNTTDFEHYYFIHYFSKSTEEFINKIKRGDALYNFKVSGNIKKYFSINKITLEKIKMFEKELKINLFKHKKFLKLKSKGLNIANHVNNNLINGDNIKKVDNENEIKTNSDK